MDYLRQMSFEEERRTIFHDLITPHRSYAFKVKGDSVVVAFVVYTSLSAYANTDASLSGIFTDSWNRPTSLIRSTLSRTDRLASSRIKCRSFCSKVK